MSSEDMAQILIGCVAAVLGGTAGGIVVNLRVVRHSRFAQWACGQMGDGHFVASLYDRPRVCFWCTKVLP